MKKSANDNLILVLLLSAFFLFALTAVLISQTRLFYSPPPSSLIPQDCSPQNVGAVFNTIFDQDGNIGGNLITPPNPSGQCTVYTQLKRNGEDIYILRGDYFPSLIIARSWAFHIRMPVADGNLIYSTLAALPYNADVIGALNF